MNKSRRNTKASLTMRILVGIYLVYTAYSLIGGFSEYDGAKKIIFISFAVLFAAGGCALVAISGKALVNKEYAEGDDITNGPGEDAEESNDENRNTKS